MGKSIRNTDSDVSSKDDVMSLLSGGQTGGGPKQAPTKKAATPANGSAVTSKDETMDLLSGTVKKKDGNAGSSATSSPSPSVSPEKAVDSLNNKTVTGQEVKVLAQTDQGKKAGWNLMSNEDTDIFAQAHNGPKKADLMQSMNKIIDDNFPVTKDPKQTAVRFQIKQGVLGGSQTAILQLKKSVLSSIQDQMNKREEEVIGNVDPDAWTLQQHRLNEDPAYQQLQKRKQDAGDAIDEYGKIQLVGGKEMEPWLKLDSEHPNILTSVAAEKLGKLVEQNYGVKATGPNKEYDRMRTGFELITKSLQMDINEALAYGIPIKNQELIKKAQDKLITLARYRNMYDRLDVDQFPDVGLDKTARYLGDIIAEKHPNKLIRTKEDVREAGNVAEERNPGFKDKYGHFVDVAAQRQDQGTFIPRGGGKLNEFLGGFETASAQAAIDLMKWDARGAGNTGRLADLEAEEKSAGMRGTTQSGTEATKIVYDKEGKAYREVPNENYGVMPWNNAFRFIGQSLPGLMEFAGAEVATEGLATVVAAGRLSKGAKAAAGLIGASYMTSYNSNREFADANIDDNTGAGEAKKIVAANFLTLANAGVFHALGASPSKMVEAAISKAVMPDVVEMFEKNSWEKLSKEMTDDFLHKSVLPRAKAVMEKFAESAGAGAKMGSASVIDQKMKDLVGVMTNSKYTPSTIEDNARTFTQQALLMTVMGAPGMISSGLMPHTTREALHQAGLYGPQYIEEINDRVESGELDQHKGAGMISMIKTMSEELAKAQHETNDDGTPLTTRQVRDLAIARWRQRAAGAMEENGVDPGSKASGEAEKEAKEIKKENNWQAIEETPTFKSISIVDENGKKEKVKSMADIDPAKEYNYTTNEDGEVTTDGATLIHHLETGDIYEKEEPDNKMEEGKDAPDAEGENKEPAKDQAQAIVEPESPASGSDGGNAAAEAPRGNNDAESQQSDEPLDPAAEEANRNIANHLQASYDRLIASGADPNDSEMVRMRERIEKLSPKAIDNGNDVQKTESDAGQEGGVGGQGSQGPEGQENDDEKEKVVSDGGGKGTEPTGSGPAPEGRSSIVGIRDSIVNADRVHRGLQPLVKEFTRSWRHNWNELKRNIGDGFSPRKFIADEAAKILADDKKKYKPMFSDYDYASLLFDRLNIQNGIYHATDTLNEALGKGDGEAALGEQSAAQDKIDSLNAQLSENEAVGRAAKSESGRSLSAIQMISKMNGELTNWSDQVAAEFNGHVPDKIKEFVSRIENEYKEKNEDLRKHYEELFKKAADDEFKKAKKEATSDTSKPKKSVKVKGKELADKVRGLRDKLGTNKTDTLQANVFGLLPAVVDGALVTIANAIEAGANIVDAINEGLKGIDFDSDKNKQKFINYMRGMEDPNYAPAKQDAMIDDLKSIAEENDTKSLVPSAIKTLKSLMRSYVSNKDVNNLDDLVKKTKDALADSFPDADEREIRDAFSGYGMRSDTEGHLKSEMAKMAEQARDVSKYQDLLKRPPGETKADEEKRLAKARKMAEKVSGYMRAAGIEEEPPPSTPEGKKALALERAKKRTTSIIDDLNRQILAGERKERNGVEPDADLNILRAERKKLSDRLNEIENSKVAPEEKIKQTEDALNRQIANYERQIKNGLDPMRPKADRPTTAQIDELRKRKAELKRQVDGMRTDLDPSLSPAQRATIKYNEGLQRQINRMSDRIANKDYDNVQPKVPVDVSRDRISLALEARLKKLQSDFYSTRRAAEAMNSGTVKKIMSLLATTKRAFVLSRISTFGRLGSAVGWNTIFEPAGEAVAGTIGYGASKVGIGRKINAIGERYGVPNAKALGTMWAAEGQALKSIATKQAWRDFVSDVRNGYNELSLMYGHGNESIPKEARDTWMNIEHGLEAFGRAHGAIKGFSKRMEFTRSYMIRKEAVRRKGGADVNNPVVQQSIGAMAYQDAMRSILMEDNILSEKYQDAIHALQKGGFTANIVALTLQEMMPIVKIPTNLVLNAGRATLGTPLAGGAIAVRGMIDLISGGKSEYGISKLTPVQADALLRNMRKGNVGMALMLAGFFAPNAFGASHYYKKGTDQPDGLEEGEVKFMGVTVPKWLADNPYLVTMKIGASLRNAFDYYTDDQGVGTAQAAVRAFKETAISAVEETPIASTPEELVKWAEGYSSDWFWYSQVKGTLEPGILQEIAEDTDNRNSWSDVFFGDRVKRKPSNTWDAIKTGIPGARETVDEK